MPEPRKATSKSKETRPRKGNHNRIETTDKKYDDRTRQNLTHRTGPSNIGNNLGSGKERTVLTVVAWVKVAFEEEGTFEDD